MMHKGIGIEHIINVNDFAREDRLPGFKLLSSYRMVTEHIGLNMPIILDYHFFFLMVL
jgi:hypothetical protein